MMKPTASKTEDGRTEAVDASSMLHIWDRAAGALAAAQGWRCPGCGLTIGGGTGTIALTAITRRGVRTAVVPVIAHDACLDDARFTGSLRDVADVAVEGAGADAESAEAARCGALVNAVDEAARLLARLPKLRAEQDAGRSG